MMIFVLQNDSSALMVASNKGHIDIVKTLIEAGANVNQTNKVPCMVYRLLYSNTCYQK